MQFRDLKLVNIGIVLAFPAIAQGETEEPYQLNTVTVTATRDEQQMLDLPASVGSKGSDEIGLDSPAYQKDLFNSISGVRVTQTGSTLGHMTSIRMPLNTGPYYLFLQDGIPVQSSRKGVKHRINILFDGLSAQLC